MGYGGGMAPVSGGWVIYGTVKMGDATPIVTSRKPSIIDLCGIYPKSAIANLETVFVGVRGIVYDSNIRKDPDIPSSEYGVLPEIAIGCTFQWSSSGFLTSTYEAEMKDVTSWKWFWTNNRGASWHPFPETSGVLTGATGRDAANPSRFGVKCRAYNGGIWIDSYTIWDDLTTTPNSGGGSVTSGDPIVYISGVTIENIATTTRSEWV